MRHWVDHSLVLSKKLTRCRKPLHKGRWFIAFRSLGSQSSPGRLLVQHFPDRDFLTTKWYSLCKVRFLNPWLNRYAGSLARQLVVDKMDKQFQEDLNTRRGTNVVIKRSAGLLNTVCMKLKFYRLIHKFGNPSKGLRVVQWRRLRYACPGHKQPKTNW